MSKFINDHKFFCLKCGQESFPVLRRDSLVKEKFHRKRLYCYHCKTDVNHVECKTKEEELEFQELFAEGVFEDEAKESMDYVRTERFW